MGGAFQKKFVGQNGSLTGCSAMLSYKKLSNVIRVGWWGSLPTNRRDVKDQLGAGSQSRVPQN